MDICGEHGDEIAFAVRDCPACYGIEELKDQHHAEIRGIEENLQSDINDMQDIIDDLQAQIEELESK